MHSHSSHTAINADQVELPTAQEIVRLSELYMEGTIQCALAADSRALALSAILATAATALSGGGLALLIASTVTRADIALGCAALVGGAGLFAGLWNALQAGRPRNFYVSGNELNAWRNEEDLYGDLGKALIGQAEIYQQQITENRETLEASSDYFDRAMRSLIWAPICALATALAIYLIIQFCDALT